MDEEGENVDRTNAKPTTDDDAKIEQILEIAHFLEGMDDSSDNNDQIKKLNEMLGSLSPGQINIHIDDFDEQTLLHIAVQEGLLQAASALLGAGASVSEQNYAQYIPLHIACEAGNFPLVKLLLDYESSIQATDWDGWSPLHWAASEGEIKVVNLLLERKADVLAPDGNNDTPFHIAADYGYTEMVELFLKESKQPLLVALGKWKMTALHRAAFEGREEIINILLDKGAKVDTRDVDGWTPLMAAIRGNHLTSVGTLLERKKYDQALLQDNAGKTPLRVAIEDDYLEGVNVLMEHMPNGTKLDHEVYERVLLYETSRVNDEERKMHECIQKSILDALKNDERAFDEALLWAAAKYERHRIARKLLISNPSPGLGPNEPPDPNESPDPNVIKLATRRKNPDVLWWLIATSPRNSKIIENIDSALVTAKEEEQKAQTKSRQEAVKTRTTRQGAKRGNKSKPDDDNHTTTAPTDDNQPSDWTHIVDILQDPQIAQVYEDSVNLDLPRLKPEHITCVRGFKALIARFYKAKYVSSTIRRMRDLKDTVYDKGPTKIMTTAASDLMNTMGKGRESKSNNAKSARLEATYDKDNLRFTYIHLPATNIEWMKDILLRITVDEKFGNGASSYHDVSSFLQSTWFEIPDRNSQSRFMRPQFVERIPIASTSKKNDEGTAEKRSEEEKRTASNNTQHEEVQDSVARETKDHGISSEETNEQGAAKGKEQEDDFVPSSALYMPFLSFATQIKDPTIYTETQGGSGENSRRLMKAYESSVVHSPATLDEAYYHFEPKSSKAQADREERNYNQVVTKQWKHTQRLGSNQLSRWPLLRVNQIWIWTIDNKWVISATSHPVDDVEQSWLDGFTEHLNKQIEAGGAQSQPGSTKDMMKAIVDYCIGSYERRRTYRDHLNQDWQIGLSIRQIFSNYINHIGRDETELFTKIQRLENGSNTSSREEIFKQATIQAKNLFGEIKDIRDELNIIKSIVNYQNIVQRQLFETDQKELGLAASYIVNDITELESLASRIQSSVDSTLSLLQSEIANFQAQESVKQGEEASRQGDILMAFTLSTIVFLPLSFLSSLFALDVDSFQKAPAWAFGVIFGVSFAFTGLAFVIFIDRSVREYIHKKINGGDTLPTHQ